MENHYDILQKVYGPLNDLLLTLNEKSEAMLSGFIAKQVIDYIPELTSDDWKFNDKIEKIIIPRIDQHTLAYNEKFIQVDLFGYVLNFHKAGSRVLLEISTEDGYNESRLVCSELLPLLKQITKWN